MMFITSSRPSGSSSTTEATMTRAEALPIAPASSDSAWCTRSASAGERLDRLDAAAARRRPRTPPARARARGSGRAASERSLHRGAAAPEPRPAPAAGCLSASTNSVAWLCSAALGPLSERDADVAADVREHAPEQAVRDVVEARAARRAAAACSRSMPNDALRQERDRQPAGLGERGQQQRVEPDQEAGGEPAHRAGARAAFPEDAADDRGRELRDGRERDEADRDQRVRFAGEVEVEVAQHQDQDDRAAPDAEQQRRTGRGAR